METVKTLFRRDDGELPPDIINKLLIVFLVLIIVCLISVGILFLIRRRRQAHKKATLPLYHEEDGNLAVRRSHHRRVSSITISSGVPLGQGNARTMFIETEKRELRDKSSSPPTSPLPQIRVTFPEEVDDHGQKQSGRSVVVHIGEQGNMGMEPVDEKLPPYSAHERFVSLDLDRMGGLKEKPIPQDSRPTQ